MKTLFVIALLVGVACVYSAPPKVENKTESLKRIREDIAKGYKTNPPPTINLQPSSQTPK